MSTTPIHPTSTTDAAGVKTTLLPPLVAALLGLLPLLTFWSSFKKLFWFGDELCLLSEMSKQGLFAWSTQTFAENAVPVFKLLWGGLTIGGSGSYFVMIVALWLTHALNCGLLTRLLIRSSIAPVISLLAVATFALAPSIHESLGWTVQWSAILVMTFFLLGLTTLQSRVLNLSSPTLTLVLIFLCSLGAAFSFSRGILACLILGMAVFLSRRSSKLPLWSPCVALIPAVIAAGQVMLSSTGNHQHLGQSVTESSDQILSFALNFFFMNPVFRWFSDSPPDLTALWLCGTVKTMLWIAALLLARAQGGFLKLLIITFLFFDLGNTALVTMGRFHTGAQYAVSSRYQYETLIFLIPGVVALLSTLDNQLRGSHSLRLSIFALLFAATTTLSFTRWSPIIEEWSNSRGTHGRKFFFSKPKKRPGEWWGLPNILAREEAERVIKYYNLH